MLLFWDTVYIVYVTQTVHIVYTVLMLKSSKICGTILITGCELITLYYQVVISLLQ